MPLRVIFYYTLRHSISSSFFVSLSTLPFTDRPCVRLLMIRSPVIIFSMETSRSTFTFLVADSMRTALPPSVVLVLLCSLPPVTLSASSCVQNLLPETLCVNLRAEFTPGGHCRVQHAASALYFSPVVDRVCFHLVLYASSDCHPVEVIHHNGFVFQMVTVDQCLRLTRTINALCCSDLPAAQCPNDLPDVFRRYRLSGDSEVQALRRLRKARSTSTTA